MLITSNPVWLRSNCDEKNHYYDNTIFLSYKNILQRIFPDKFTDEDITHIMQLAQLFTYIRFLADYTNLVQMMTERNMKNFVQKLC